MSDKKKTLVLTKRARASYANIEKPRAVNEDSEPAYSITLMIPKSDTATIEALRNAQAAAVENKWGAKRPKRIAQTIKDGDKESEYKGDDGVDTEKNPEYAGHWILTVRNTRRPGLKGAPGPDGRATEIEPAAFYSGCYVRAAVEAFCYERTDGNGVTFSLQGLQKVGEGEPLGAHFDDSLFDDGFDDFDADDDDLF